ncbi:tetraspanin-7-like [Protopterus annectens]|uniref:tetraspanin-7-like n=1 Tax=Protopterus annectens TaxID=7888 RepID=UPI001CFAF319|nr:tetraspanin-7-like [Protopterus annectens]
MTGELPCDALSKVNLVGRQDSLELICDGGGRRSSSPRVSVCAKSFPGRYAQRKSIAELSVCQLPAYSESIPVQCSPAFLREAGVQQSVRFREASLASDISHTGYNSYQVLGWDTCQYRAVAISRGAMALLKLLLMVFSFVFWVAGLAMFTVGIWAKISLGNYLVLSTNDYPNTPFILLATGAAVIIWGFLGCFSAATEHKCLLKTYGVFQMAVLIAGLSAGLSGLFYRKDIAEGFQNGLREAVQAYGEDEEKANALDDIQRTLDCCGVDSYTDWFSSPWSGEQLQNGSVPISCCTVRKGCPHSPVAPDARGIYQDGCFKKIFDFVNDNMFYIATGALGLAVVQVVGIVLACLLSARIPARAAEGGNAGSNRGSAGGTPR